MLLKNKYDVVHVDASTPMDVVIGMAAKKAGVNYVIIHSHIAGDNKHSWFRSFYFDVCRRKMIGVFDDYAKSIINDDNVFWNRRTDNLLCNSQLTASSGDAEKLRDFLILDTSNIIEKNPYLINYSRGTWAPDGNNAWVKAEWKKNVKFDRIIFHGSLNTIETRTVNLTIYADGNVIGSVDKINPYGRDTILLLFTRHLA